MSVTSIAQSVHSAQNASLDEVVLGVDTHRDVHVAAVLSTLGALVEIKSFPTTSSGYRRMLTGAPQLRHGAASWSGMHGL